MRTAAYCRFSSDSQREASITDQLRNIEMYCKRMGWPLPTLHQDKAISGSRNDRAGYLAMLEAAEIGAFDVLLIDDFTRLGRDHIESTIAIRRLKFIGIRVIGASDGTDTARDGYKLDIGLKGLMGEHFLDDLAKKTHRGLMGQALSGYSAGGLPYGYTSLHDGAGFKRVINEEQAQWVRFIFERYSQGASPRQIADELNRNKVLSPRGGTWAHSALYPDAKGVGMLGNEMYNGRQVWNKTNWLKNPETGRRVRTIRPKSEWVIIESPELQIVSDESWLACQNRIKKSRHKPDNKHAGGAYPKYLFSGLLKCGECGSAYVIMDRKKYGCAANKDRGTSVCSNGLRVKRETIERVLLAGVKERLLSDESYRAFEAEARALLKMAKPDPAAAKRQIAAAKKELDNLMTAIKAGIITPTTKAALQEAEQHLADATQELKAIERYEPTQLLPRAREIYRDMVSQLENVEDVTTAREVLRVLIGNVRLVAENGTLTAEMKSAGLADALQISVVAGTRCERYLQSEVIRFEGLT